MSENATSDYVNSTRKTRALRRRDKYTTAVKRRRDSEWTYVPSCCNSTIKRNSRPRTLLQITDNVRTGQVLRAAVHIYLNHCPPAALVYHSLKIAGIRSNAPELSLLVCTCALCVCVLCCGVFCFVFKNVGR